MVVVPGDVVYFLSGGSSNSDPNSSIGGNPSSTPILGNVNNLFSNISPEENTAGKTDYRCFYIFNQNGVDSLYNTIFYINSQTTGGSQISIGVKEATDVQAITITGTVSGGSFTISYEGQPVVVNYDSDLAVWNENLQNGLNDNTDLSGVSSTAASGAGSRNFTLSFLGNDDYRFHDLIELVSNDLVGSASITLSKISDGSPVNAIADLLDFDTNSPNNVIFKNPTFDLPINIGLFGPADGVPVWIKRVTPAGVIPIEYDGFQMGVYGNPIDT